MRILLLPLSASLLSGLSAVLEKMSVVSLSPLTVLTLRYGLMLPVLLVALVASGSHREVTSLDAKTFLTILIPAAMALGSLTLYFTALKGDLLSRVFPLTELGPVIAFILAALLLGEPWSVQRLAGTVLVIAGIVLCS